MSPLLCAMDLPRGYRGESIDIRNVLEDISRETKSHNWKQDVLPLPGAASNFVAYHRVSAPSVHRLYLSTGIHGDEPAGPLAILKLLRENAWPDGVDIFLCPCLNFNGFPLNRRENENGIDLNRDYRNTQSAEVRSHIAWLESKPSFDISLCLHEDWEAKGFYLYELNPDARVSLARHIIAEVETVCSIDRSDKIDDWDAKDGIIHPPLNPAERPQWPEALYLIQHKTRLSYTFEAPSDFPIATRVAALVKAVRAVTDSFPTPANENSNQDSALFTNKERAAESC